jgi:hypothetical protein
MYKYNLTPQSQTHYASQTNLVFHMVTEPSLPQNASSAFSTTTAAMSISSSPSSSTLPAAPAIVLMLVSEKLVRTNHSLWRAQVLAILQGAQLDSFLEDTTKSPEKVIKI